MEVGGSGDSQSWYEQAVHEEARENSHKRKRMEADQPAYSQPFPLGPKPGRREAVKAIYDRVVNRDLPQKNITSLAVGTYYQSFTPAVVKTLANQVLCMIAKYHLACLTRGYLFTSPVIPEAVD